MNALILTRDEGEQLSSCEGKHVVCLDNESGTYREWLVRVAHTTYCVIDEDGGWTLLRQDPDSRDWLETEADVETFLATHRLILAA